MDPLLLAYYNQELSYLKEMGAEFSRQHPKIARRLGMKGLDVADPYVERLLEGFAFLSARTQIKLEAEFPRFTQRLLEVIYPNYLSPTPSMSVVQINPNFLESDLSKGYMVPRQTELYNRVPGEGDTDVVFRTTQEVQLWPIQITNVQLTASPPDLLKIEQYIPPSQHVHGALRITLQTIGNIPFKTLNLDELPFYLCGEERISSQLFELIHARSITTLIFEPNKINQSPTYQTPGVQFCAMDAEDSMLPVHWNSYHGHNLLQEYFSFPSRFYFFTIPGMQKAVQKCEGNELEIVILLNEFRADLISHTNLKEFSLYCTPVINLFEKQADRIEVNTKQTEFHLVINKQRPIDYEVYRIKRVFGQKSKSAESQEFRSLFATLNSDEGNFGRYYAMNRELRLLSDSTRKYGARTQYIGSEVFLSLVDQFEAPFSDDIRYLTVEAEVTNRDLGVLLSQSGKNDLKCRLSLPSKNIAFVRPVSPTRPPFALRERAWRLIRLLSFNYLNLMELSERESGQALRDLLCLFVPDQDEGFTPQIQSLLGCDIKAVNRRLPINGPLIYGRGVECSINIDEQGFGGHSPFLFGLILEHFISKHVGVNIFTQIHLTSLQRGTIYKFPLRAGRRTIV